MPIENSEMALLGRLKRIFRVLRMISKIPKLRILVNSLIKTMPQLGYVMLLMFIIFYIYAAVEDSKLIRLKSSITQSSKYVSWYYVNELHIEKHDL